MSEQPLDLRASVRAIWWRRRLLGALAGIGLVGGLAYGVIRPPLPSAVALVLLPPTSLNSSGAPTRDVNTEILIATSNPVLVPAGKSVSPPIAAATLKHQVVVTSLSQDIFQIKVHASSGTDAKRIADAVAHDYIQFVATSSSASTKTVLAGLEHESSQLTHQIQDLQTQIDTVTAQITAEGATSTPGQQDSSLLGSLGDEQQQVSLQLDDVNNQVDTDQLSGAAAAQGTRILQNATTVGSTSNLVTSGVLGAVLGLLVGVLLAFVRYRRSRRLWRRDEIAAAIEVPVLASADAPHLRTPAEWTSFLETYEPSPVDEWNLRRLLHRLAPGHLGTGSEVRVLSFTGDSAAATAGPQIAMFANEMGRPTTLVPCDDESFAPLRAARAAHPGVEQREPHVTTSGRGWDQSGGPLTVSMMAVDTARPTLDASPGTVLLAVSSGFASANVLAGLALAALDAGHAIDGILVINPDPRDNTSGAIADAGAIVPTLRREGSSEPRVASVFEPAPGAGIEVVSASANGNGSGYPAVNGAGAKDKRPEDDAGQFISLRVVAAAAREHWRPLLAVALVGLLLGAGLHRVVPRKYAATTTLYLSEPSDSDPAQAMANDLSLLQTRAVAERAVADLHLRVTAGSFLSSYQGLVLSNAILLITVSAHSPGDAVLWADAVARGFLAVRTELLRAQTHVVVASLNSQVQSFDSQINNLTSSINALSSSPTGSPSGNELATLVDERSADTSQVSQLESEIQQQQLGETTVTQSSVVLDRAAAVKVSATRVTVIDALSGLIGGLGLALIALVVGVLLSDRLRNRAQVAAALGAPIDLSLLRYASRHAMRKRDRRQLLLHPTPALQMMERRLRAALESAGGTSLAVVELETAEPSALALSMLAFSLASEGLSVVMIDMAKGRPLASVLGVTGNEKGLHTVTLEGASAVLIVGPDDPAEMGHEWNPPGAAALLVLTSVDPAFGSGQLANWTSEAVVIVNPRKVPSGRITAAGELLRQAGMAIRSAILLGLPPEEDDSLGVVGSAQVGDAGQGANDMLQGMLR